MTTKRFAILGAGRWGKIVAQAVHRIGHLAEILTGLRLAPGQNWNDYQMEWRRRLEGADVDIVWIATPPGNHIVPLCHACLDVGINVIIEKPWMGKRDDMISIVSKATAKGLLVAVNYQYLFLDFIESARSRWVSGADDKNRIDIRFTIDRPPRSPLSAIYNLGAHLFAIKMMLDENAEISGMSVGYYMENARQIVISNAECSETFDFTENSEPILERFVQQYVRAINGDDVWVPSLYFSQRVYEEMVFFNNSRALMVL
ncbi:MAG: Gfo/Idh/MocA family oxidoreductase [Sulfurimonas sp.]|nr:Gfo/Idh/MocA family oxidoreductase [Sulfurimonas sp.]